jgi:hypothetical protein
MTTGIGRRLACAAAAALMCACRSLSAVEPQPAVMTSPTAETRAELRHAVSRALHGASVTLADDALMHDSVLVIEHARARDAAGFPLNGRELDRPQHFSLVIEGSHCVLIQESTGHRWRLRHATCTPKSQAPAP